MLETVRPDPQVCYMPAADYTNEMLQNKTFSKMTLPGLHTHAHCCK